MAYMSKERSLVCRDFMVLMAWGKKERVVRTAAISPIVVIPSIVFIFLPNDSCKPKYRMNGGILNFAPGTLDVIKP